MSKDDTPGVHFPPPLIFFLFGLGGWWLGKKTGLIVFNPSHFLDICSLLLLMVGLVLVSWSVFPFFFHKTSLLPWKADSKLLSDGPYKFSRNPMYAGMAFFYVGLTIAIGSGLALVFLIPLIWVMNRYVIAGEEAYLTRTFGKEYEKYQNRVRRWI